MTGAGGSSGARGLRSWARALAAGLLVFVVAIVVLLSVFVRRLADDEMSWSLRRGEFVLVVPDRVRPADVVMLRDPLDPARTVLRRVVARGGQKVSFDEGGARVDAKRLRQQEMGDQPGIFVRKETIWSKPPARANDHLLAVRSPVTRWISAGVVTVPEGHLFLLADARDAAVDSRWWGPVPESAVIGVVRAHLAEPDLWRPRLRFVRPEE